MASVSRQRGKTHDVAHMRFLRFYRMYPPILLVNVVLLDYYIRKDLSIGGYDRCARVVGGRL